MVIVRLLVGGAGRVGAATRQVQNMMHMCAVYAVADKHLTSCGQHGPMPVLYGGRVLGDLLRCVSDLR